MRRPWVYVHGSMAVRHATGLLAFKIYKLNFTREVIHLTWHWLSHLMVILIIAVKLYRALNIFQGSMLNAFFESSHPYEVDMNHYPHSTKWVDRGRGDGILLMVIQVMLCGSGFHTHTCQIPKCIPLIRMLHCLRCVWGYAEWNFDMEWLVRLSYFIL